jgi:hypothetical protein
LTWLLALLGCVEHLLLGVCPSWGTCLNLVSEVAVSDDCVT